jgi:hypothetical protein
MNESRFWKTANRSRIPRMATRSALTSLLILVLLGSNGAFATKSQPLHLDADGGVVDLGIQDYAVKGGQILCGICFAVVVTPDGQSHAFVPSSTHVAYELRARASGTSVTGSAHFHIDGTTTSGAEEAVDAQIKLGESQLSQQLQLIAEVQIGTSALPVFFVGDATVQVTTGDTTLRFQTTMQLENPYFNPFGAPIILASTDGTVSLVITYSQGSIKWTGTVLSGRVSGTLGSTTPVAGVENVLSSENEDLVRGTASDEGDFSFTSMTPSVLDVSAHYHGSSVIPRTGTSDCSASFTGVPGTCTATGFNSIGQFSTLDKESAHIAGKYSTQWVAPPGMPALGFVASMTARETPA